MLYLFNIIYVRSMMENNINYSKEKILLSIIIILCINLLIIKYINNIKIFYYIHENGIILQKLCFFVLTK